MARLARMSATRRRKVVAAISLFYLQILAYDVALVTQFLELVRTREHRGIRNAPRDDGTERGHDLRMRFMSRATEHSDASSLALIRMNRRLFRKFCELLVVDGGLKGRSEVDVDEMVVVFLYTIARNENKLLSKVVGRSEEMISRLTRDVLRAVLKLHRVLIKHPVPVPADSDDVKWKHFANCVGALDGRHINVRAPEEDDQSRYRNKKGNLSMNVLGVCNPNSEFIYCLSGWEGSADDARVLRDALTRPNALEVPQGTYYLCDARYPNRPGFLTPYRGQRYKLNDWGANGPNTPEEYFNMKHAGARNSIERAFGVMEKRWAILRDPSWFSFPIVARIVVACSLIHNFIKREQGVDEFERSYIDQEPEQQGKARVQRIDDDLILSTVQPSPEWTQFRNEKA